MTAFMDNVFSANYPDGLMKRVVYAQLHIYKAESESMIISIRSRFEPKKNTPATESAPAAAKHTGSHS